MRPQDIVVLLKLVLLGSKPWRFADLAHELELSSSEVFAALERCRIAGLVDPSKRKVFKSALGEFLFHGLRYVFPIEPGPLVRGIPTAHSAPPLSRSIVSNKDQYVWETEDGEMRGQLIRPLYPSVPRAAKKDPALHETLALVDALRVGRTRERKLAKGELSRRLGLGDGELHAEL